MSERNGFIQCYIVYLVRLKSGQSTADLPPPEELPVTSYRAVHRPGHGGAYLADAVDGDHWTPEVFLGDERVSAANNRYFYCCCLGKTGGNSTWARISQFLEVRAHRFF